MLILLNKAIAVAETVEAVSTIPPKGVAEKLLRKIGMKTLGNTLLENSFLKKVTSSYSIERPVNVENIEKCKKMAIECRNAHAYGMGLHLAVMAGWVIFGFFVDTPVIANALVFGYNSMATLFNGVTTLLNVEHLLRMNRLLRINRPSHSAH